MGNNLIGKVSNFLTQTAGPGRVFVVYFLVAVLVAAPILIAWNLRYDQIGKNYDTLTLSRRQALARLSAELLKERLDHLVDVGLSLASRVRFRQLIQEAKWLEAYDIVNSALKDFPSVEVLGLATTDGVMMANPEELASFRGQDFSGRDWYRGVAAEWEPYVSEVFRAANNVNSIVIAVPIRSDQNEVLGILTMQILTDTLLDWVKEVEVGEDGIAYFVDHHANVVAHPKFAPQSQVVSFASIPIIQKVLRGERGTELQYNSIEKETRLAAFEPVAPYGWGVVVAQPEKSAFKLKNDDLRSLGLILGGLAFVDILFAVLALAIIRRKNV